MVRFGLGSAQSADPQLPPGYLYPGFIDTPVHPDDPEHAQKTNDPNPEIYTRLFKDQSRVFVYDWFKNDTPSEANF
jgi:hypothetical protein